MAENRPHDGQLSYVHPGWNERCVVGASQDSRGAPDAGTGTRARDFVLFHIRDAFLFDEYTSFAEAWKDVYTSVRGPPILDAYTSTEQEHRPRLRSAFDGVHHSKRALAPVRRAAPVSLVLPSSSGRVGLNT